MSAPLTFETLKAAVHAALNAWNQLDGTPLDRLEDLLLVQERRAAMAGELPVTLRLATNEVLHVGLEELDQCDEASANILTWRYLDSETVQAVANRIHLGRDQFMRRQRKAIAALTQIIFDQEMAARQLRTRAVEAQLIPPSYDTLFGVEAEQAKLVDLLLHPQAPGIITLTGIGGIGKSSLANASVRQIIPYFRYDRVLWLLLNSPSPSDGIKSVPSLSFDDMMAQLWPLVAPHLSPYVSAAQRNQELHQLLKEFPHLIIIDNLEGELGGDLLTRLHSLAYPSKFLLTSRRRLSSPIGLYNLPVRELSAEAAVALIRHHAKNLGAAALAEAADEHLARIFQRVGGNPLALKLVVGLNHDLSLSQILDGLFQVNIQAVANLYRHIYWHIWQTLSPIAKALLEVMPLAADTGMVQSQMQAVSQLDEHQVITAIQELSQRSLLEVRGTPLERRYALHSLTRTFLRSEIIHWPEDQTA